MLVAIEATLISRAFQTRLYAANESRIVTPGLSVTTFTSGANFCNWLGLPVNTGNVPKCMGITVFALSNLQAKAASRGPMVK
jgi:hypothetical protein